MIKCWKCGAEQCDTTGKLPFRALCDSCHAWLHCCKNCKNYRVGLPNNCLIPGTEFIADAEGINFCEEFQLAGVVVISNIDRGDIEKKLFKDVEEEKTKRNFGDLFGD